jgi:hypothetical protein
MLLQCTPPIPECLSSTLILPQSHSPLFSLGDLPGTGFATFSTTAMNNPFVCSQAPTFSYYARNRSVKLGSHVTDLFRKNRNPGGHDPIRTYQPQRGIEGFGRETRRPKPSAGPRVVTREEPGAFHRLARMLLTLFSSVVRLAAGPRA